MARRTSGGWSRFVDHLCARRWCPGLLRASFFLRADAGVVGMRWLQGSPALLGPAGAGGRRARRSGGTGVSAGVGEGARLLAVGQGPRRCPLVCWDRRNAHLARAIRNRKSVQRSARGGRERSVLLWAPGLRRASVGGEDEFSSDAGFVRATARRRGIHHLVRPVVRSASRECSAAPSAPAARSPIGATPSTTPNLTDIDEITGDLIRTLGAGQSPWLGVAVVAWRLAYRRGWAWRSSHCRVSDAFDALGNVNLSGRRPLSTGLRTRNRLGATGRQSLVAEVGHARLSRAQLLLRQWTAAPTVGDSHILASISSGKRRACGAPPCVRGRLAALCASCVARPSVCLSAGAAVNMESTAGVIATLVGDVSIVHSADW